MSLHIVTINQGSFAVVGYTRESDMTWAVVARHEWGETCVCSFSPSLHGVSCAFAVARHVGSCSLAIEQSITTMIVKEMKMGAFIGMPGMPKEDYVDWTKDIPMNIDFKEVDKIISYVLQSLFGSPVGSPDTKPVGG